MAVSGWDTTGRRIIRAPLSADGVGRRPKESTRSAPRPISRRRLGRGGAAEGGRRGCRGPRFRIGTAREARRPSMLRISASRHGCGVSCRFGSGRQRSNSPAGSGRSATPGPRPAVRRWQQAPPPEAGRRSSRRWPGRPGREGRRIPGELSGRRLRRSAGRQQATARSRPWRRSYGGHAYPVVSSPRGASGFPTRRGRTAGRRMRGPRGGGGSGGGGGRGSSRSSVCGRRCSGGS